MVICVAVSVAECMLRYRSSEQQAVLLIRFAAQEGGVPQVSLGCGGECRDVGEGVASLPCHCLA